MTDVELCSAWRSTYLPVLQADDAGTMEYLSAFRAACLDELEQRNPAAFTAWMNSGAKASSDPREA